MCEQPALETEKMIDASLCYAACELLQHTTLTHTHTIARTAVICCVNQGPSPAATTTIPKHAGLSLPCMSCCPAVYTVPLCPTVLMPFQSSSGK